MIKVLLAQARQLDKETTQSFRVAQLLQILLCANPITHRHDFNDDVNDSDNNVDD